MIPFTIVCAYCLVSLLTARRIFSRIRTSQIQQFPHSSFDGEDATLTGLLALITGVFWPMALPLAAVVYKPTKSPAELKAERDAAVQRIRELETELGIRSEP